METMNGKTNGHARGYDAAQPVYALRVFRVEPGQQVFCRTLSESYGGLFTHFFRGRSHYCAGEQCPAIMHKERKFWKGYAAVELCDVKRKLWYPQVLEITEHLEIDMRGVFARGQIWEVFRHAEAKKGEPVRGTLQPHQEFVSLPPAFDITPVVRTLYHWLEPLRLDVKNPLPPRVLVQPVADDMPAAVQEREEGNGSSPPADFSFAQAFEEQMRQRAAKTRK